jgi:hypothetical protein
MKMMLVPSLRTSFFSQIRLNGSNIRPPFLLDQNGVNLCKAKMKKMEAKLLKAENQPVNCKVE